MKIFKCKSDFEINNYSDNHGLASVHIIKKDSRWLLSAPKDVETVALVGEDYDDKIYINKIYFEDYFEEVSDND